jgi:sugar phosphate isomerase/epimerase
MRLGIFAKAFVRPTLGATLDAVRAHGFDCVHFNLVCAGLPALPDALPACLPARISEEFETRKITMAAVSGTFNMIHPDRAERSIGLRRLRVLAECCQKMGTRIITLCTGTRAPDDMWLGHPDNNLPEAWDDLRASLEEGLRIAGDNDLVLGIEPEVANVVDSAAKARRLLDEFGSPRLKIVFDAANFFHFGELGRMHDILSEAAELLGKDIVLAHAKDLVRDGAAGDVAAGRGLLDYDLYLSLLHEQGFSGPLVLHGLAEQEVGSCADFLRFKIARIATC